MPEYEVIVSLYVIEFFESENEKTAEEEMRLSIPKDYLIDNIEVVEHE